jgi:glycosyltransferase involved in cell wall biosynthesis
LLDYSSFFLLVLFKCLLLPKQDVVLALTTPPLISIMGLILKVVKKSKYVCLVEDLYPDTAVTLGILREKSLSVKVTNLISKTIFENADKIIAISNGMKKRLLGKGIQPERIEVIDNWADQAQIYPVAKKDNWFLSKHQLGNDFIIQYSGNMGLGHEFDTCLNAALRLAQYRDLKFLFIGDGVRRQQIAEFKARHHLENIVCLPYQDRKDLAFSVSAGDVSLISLRNSLDGYIMPCKLYGIMAAARPIIFVGSTNSDIANIVKAANCGFRAEEGDVDGFMAKVLLLYQNADLLQHLGNNGRRYFLENFERKLATEKYFDVLINL